MISSYQSQVYMRARETGCTQVQSATIAGFSERSGRRIEAGEHQPQADSPREWRTRVDPLAEVWDCLATIHLADDANYSDRSDRN